MVYANPAILPPLTHFPLWQLINVMRLPSREMPKTWNVVLVSRSFCIEGAEGEMYNRQQVEGLGAGWGAALAVLLWALTGGYVPGTAWLGA